MTEDSGLAILSHVLAIFTGFIGPLIIYLASDDGSFAKENAANALNFQIIVLIASFVAFLSLFLFVGIILLPLVLLLDLIFCAIAAIKANEGEAWNYPLTPDLV